MQAFIEKLVSIITSLLLLLGIPSGSFGGNGNVTADMTVSFANEVPGSMAGSVSVKASADGDYDIYWGDAAGEKLTAEAVSYTHLTLPTKA